MKQITDRQEKRLARTRLHANLPTLLRDEAGQLCPHGAAERYFDEVHRIFSEIFARHRVVGGTVALVHQGRVIGSFAYGDARLNPGVPATADTVYRVASVSKLVCAFGVMALAERGVLSLDADIGDALGYPVRNPRHSDAPITLRQLITHTAGLLDEPLYDGPGIAGKLALRELLSPPLVQRSFSHARPGEAFRYSNFGAGIVGSVIEAATGERFDDVMQRLVFGPLDIAASFCPQRMQAYAGELACGYHLAPFPRSLRQRGPRLAYDAPALAAAPLPPMDPERDFMHTPGRLLISMPHLAKLLRLLASEGEVDGVHVLQPESLAEMRRPQGGVGSVGGDLDRGLGVAYCRHAFGRGLVLGHQGVAYGMNAELWVDPANGNGVVMATNGGSPAKAGPLVRCGWEIVRTGFALLRLM